MKQFRLFLSLLLLVGIAGYSSAAMSAEAAKPKGVKPGVISAVALNKAATYCHLTFPAIKSETLGSDKPQLQGSGGEIIDFYGPCTYDPLGVDEVCKQRALKLQRDFCD